METLLRRVERACRRPPTGSRAASSRPAYTLINRDGGAIQPGSRNYARSWIRDGAITASALLEMGFTEEVREFIRWYAAFQAPDGRVPCCIDKRGADPVLEHDSAGQFVYTIAEYYRFTHDVGFLNDLWPQVARAVDYLAALRARRMTAEYQTPDKEIFFGLLPESISHEGYSAHPVHSYWDDFFALKGLKDAADLAVVVGDREHAEKFGALRDGFRTTLYASIGRTLRARGIDFIPGSVELGDFDPTSTSIALLPGGELENLAEEALARTYERYWEEFEKRRGAGGDGSAAYSPYEVRNVGSFVRLGQRDRALALLDWSSPTSVRGLERVAEISWHDREAPLFIANMRTPGSGGVHPLRPQLARVPARADRALVLAAGVPAAWVAGDGGGSASARLPTQPRHPHLRPPRRGRRHDRMRLSGDVVVPARHRDPLAGSAAPRRHRERRAVEPDAPNTVRIRRCRPTLLQYGPEPSRSVEEHGAADRRERG